MLLQLLNHCCEPGPHSCDCGRFFFFFLAPAESCLHSQQNSRYPLPLPALTLRSPLQGGSHEVVAGRRGEAVDPLIVEPVACPFL